MESLDARERVYTELGLEHCTYETRERFLILNFVFTKKCFCSKYKGVKNKSQVCIYKRMYVFAREE